MSEEWLGFSFEEVVGLLLECPQDESTAILSTLDHRVTKLSEEDRVEYFKVQPKNFEELTTELKAYLAACAEYAANQAGAPIPNWCMNPEYNTGLLVTRTEETTEPITDEDWPDIQFYERATLEEFAKRGIEMDGVFDSF